MENMVYLYSPEELSRLDRKIKAVGLFCRLLFVAALAACVLLCLGTNSANAREHELACIAVWTAAGWIVLYLRRFTLAEGRCERQHAQMLLSGEPETLHGRVTVTEERLHILKSIRITVVTLEDGAGTHRLKVCRSREKKLRDAGEELTLFVVNGYIAGYAK